MLRFGSQDLSCCFQIRLAGDERSGTGIGTGTDVLKLPSQFQKIGGAGETVSQRVEVDSRLLDGRRSERAAKVFDMVYFVRSKTACRESKGRGCDSRNHLPACGWTGGFRFRENTFFDQRRSPGCHQVELGFEVFQVQRKIQYIGVGNG